ncbi:LPS export ABC transporter periplasmic protein LptC [Rickettsia prowazekii]|uniref:LPS export ABC transporter periplasmic protein LptC n=1 Tax=Rickettsia prowazekii TaxID=782 RepID=UPI00059DD7BA|nr:LPS export ABC transporter periplasmic protein LptC [Rickettsia prowazekii]
MPSFYKLRKKIWKSLYLLIIVGMLYIGYILIKSGYINEKNDINVTKKILNLRDNKNYDLKYNVILQDSIFEGVNKNLNAYKIKTERAIKESGNKYKLDIINAIYNINQDQALIITAKEGFLDQESNILDLKNDIKLFLDEIIFNTNNARINLVNQNIYGNSSAKLLYKNSSITSDSFNTMDENNIIIFKGNVSTIIDLSDY